ncbi:glutaredoxin family protein [Bacterioplanes sanyensis]|uniref:glutaredoxin family protein n=1 Tax=Bacterioplanes sanyensis TaxID=1249553 RepID=UPI001678C653|nr:glutaredoxin domain-containing protein [Bacterioplanes sanyensis]
MAITMNLTQQLKGIALNLMDRVVPVRPVVRDDREQCRLNRESRRMQLYFCRSCPSSIYVKRHCEKLGLRVVEKDVDRVNSFRNELVRGGGQPRVPCLRIADGKRERWLYSPDAIRQYLDSHFASNA